MLCPEHVVSREERGSVWDCPRLDLWWGARVSAGTSGLTCCVRAKAPASHLSVGCQGRRRDLQGEAVPGLWEGVGG